MEFDSKVVGYIKFIAPEYFDKLKKGEIHLYQTTGFQNHGADGIRDEYEGRTGDDVGYEVTLSLVDGPNKNSIIYSASFVTITKDLFDEQGILKQEIAEEIQASANNKNRPFVIFPATPFHKYVENEYKFFTRKWSNKTNMVQGVSAPAADFVIAPRPDDDVILQILSSRYVEYGGAKMLSNRADDAETLATKQFATKSEEYSTQREFRVLLNVFYDEKLDDEKKKKAIDIFLRSDTHMNGENSIVKNTHVWRGKEYKDLLDLSLKDFDYEV